MSVKAPPISGPATDAIPYMAPIKPVYMGRFVTGTEYVMTATLLSPISQQHMPGINSLIRAPLEIPAEPNPAMALPQIKAVEFGATPQTNEPSSKIPIARRKTHLIDTTV